MVLLEIGHIARPHGLLGEVVVALVTNRDERLDPGTVLTCRPAGGRRERLLAVRSSRPFTGRFLVVFEGVHSREAADELRGAQLLGPAIDDPDALFVHDLVGREVVEVDGTSHGEVLAVQANPASDLLVLEDGSLVPLRFVVGREEGRIVVEVPAGLFE
jgi:16S rRNA processing protein RimM